MNEFVEKTKEALETLNQHDKKYDENRIAQRGFDIEENDNNKQDCVLIIGLNPAGDEKDAKREKDINLPYLYCLDLDNKNVNIKTHCTYVKYFRPILKFVNNITDNNAKWAWCNYEENDINKICEHNDLKKYKKEILAYYNEVKCRNIAVYIGDMFYYHETKSNEIPLCKNLGNYYEEMLKLHITCLRKHNKNIKFIYINSATVSHKLNNKKDETFSIIDEVPVFYGGMLSGMRCMDSFSVKRLEKEINEKIKGNKKQV